MNSERESYVKDKRIACKYGAKCYQTNPVHHKKYKHPQKRTNKDGAGNSAKKIKMDSPPKRKDISSSEDEIADEIIETNNDNKSPNNLDDLFGDLEEFEKANPLKEASVKNDEMSLKEFIKSKFLFEMPNDFYQFYELCSALNKKNPTEAFSSVGLKLVGPFDVLAGKFNGVIKNPEEYLLHWRYFRDPPEFLTVLKGDDKSGYHIGYFWDSPEEKPVFLAENYGSRDGILNVIGDNIFAAVSNHLDEKMTIADPFTKVNIKKLSSMIKEEAEKLNFSLSKKTKSITERNKKVLASTFNKAGLVVPYIRKTQLGYRKLIMSNKDLEKLLTNLQNAKNDEEKNKYLSELQELLTATDIASDECDFGTAIELGRDIICHGVDRIDRTIARVLASNYRLLKWEPFAKIVEAHMANRRKGTRLSILYILI